jgi:enterochelin esterase family protein
MIIHMPRFSILLFLLLAGEALAQAPERRPGPTTRPGRGGIVSPEVLPDGRVTFRYMAPKAGEVSITGDFADGNHKLSKNDAGLWSITLGPFTPDLYTYSLRVDGVSTVDPRNPSVKVGISGIDNMVFISGEESKFQDNNPVAHGQLRQLWYPSKTLDAQRRMHVYTPPGYDQNHGEKFPVLYLLHGGGDDDAGWSTIGRAGFILDNLIAEGKAKPMIVVMPNGSLPRPANMPRIGRDTPPSPEAQAARAALQQRFTSELMKEIIPHVEKNFRVIAEPKSRALAGLSMGGGQTLRVLTQHPDQFAYFAIWSMGVENNVDAWSQRNQPFLGRAQELNKSIELLSVTVGDKDFLLNAAKNLDIILTKADINHEMKITGGGHTWINWRRYLRDFAPRLFQ